MSESNEIVLVGCGNMGFALLKGWLGSGSVETQLTHVVEPAEALRERAAATGVNVHAPADSLPAGLSPAMVVLAVKPQVMADILPSFRRFAGGATFVSIAAGIPVAMIERCIGESSVIRAMPNTPAAIGKGSTVLFCNPRVAQGRAEMARSLLSASGSVHFVEDETLMDAVTAISGSGPAYVFHLIECLANAGASLGLPAEIALALAKETVNGAGALAIESADDPETLRRQVTSPGGTTAAGLEVLMAAPGLRDLVARTAAAAHRRSVELSSLG
ncbi:pyrroline-5-carboxylate reductase [Sinorhizobium sp. BG8]|uniref:pyrroline-5-carboxylate reductase n=1 Tax=Sinorhizobium sp. BG8 TaxID=2613773 RepID=UPI00193E1F9C|nr:pyrroline-5-carboxylate reductase [Sinorhizobium sp. BG8]QRM57323.1 pyrroline-5-carboxylate reductase [Sinorhizobium sp. BG8]